MSLFSEEGCLGEQTKLDLGDVQGDRCIFQGGRSARLVCSPLRAPETRTPSTRSRFTCKTDWSTASYASILSSLCSGSSNANDPNATSPTANSTGSPYGGAGGSNATSSGEPPAPTQSIEPYTGRASGDQVAKPSLIALVALFAVAVLLL